MLDKGWIITKLYDESEVRRKINSIISSCNTNNDEDIYFKFGSYFRRQES